MLSQTISRTGSTDFWHRTVSHPSTVLSGNEISAPDTCPSGCGALHLLDERLRLRRRNAWLTAVTS
jgi:hypothetical protein